MNVLSTILVCAILIEACVEALKPAWKSSKHNVLITQSVSLILSIALFVTAKADVFAILGIDLSIPYFGSVVTGVIASRGSNFIHDVMKKFQA